MDGVVGGGMNRITYGGARMTITDGEQIRMSNKEDGRRRVSASYIKHGTRKDNQPI